MHGIVVCPPININLNGEFYCEQSDLDPDLLRSWLLFWDMIDFPSNNVVKIEHCNHIQFLIDEGAMKRTNIYFDDCIMSEAVINAQFLALRENEKEEGSTWSLARGENTLSFPDQETEEGRGLLIKLTNAIPVPSSEVPFEEILKFKEKNKSELFALRSYIDDLYQEILKFPDKAHAEISALSRLENAIEDHIKASKASKLDFKLVDMTARFNLTIPIASVVAASYFGLGTVTAMLGAGAGAAVINIGPSIGLKNKSEDKKSPFEYVAKVHGQLYL